MRSFAARLAADYADLPMSWQPLGDWARSDVLPRCQHGDMDTWLRALDDLPDRLMDLHPWRKGPLTLAGATIDSEWRSDLKFRRLREAGIVFDRRTVFDVGCGNGIYMNWMVEAGAKAVVGIDPTLLFAAQYLALKAEHPARPFWLLPCALEAIPPALRACIDADITLSAGVLYHRVDPIGHLRDLIAATRPGGEIIVETLVVEGDATTVLVPPGRYAQMRNVWFLPSSAALSGWMRRVGLADVAVLHESETSTDEQRRTDWMTFHSLAQFLDPDDDRLTVEGLPRPRRAILRARRSS